MESVGITKIKSRSAVLFFLAVLLALGAVCSWQTARAVVETPGSAAPANGVLLSKHAKTPAVTVSVFPTQVSQGEAATYTVTMSRVNRRRSVRVNYATSGTATLGKDYRLSGKSGQIATGQIVIPAGSRSGSIRLKLLPNNAAPGNHREPITQSARSVNFTNS